MTMTDETLMAFLDDELGVEDKAKVTTQIENSPELARRVDNMRLADSLLVQSCQRIDSRPMPPEMMALLGAFPEEQAKQAKQTASDQATILPFRKKLRQLVHAPLWQIAAAATVVLAIGLGAGRQLLTSQTGKTPAMIVAEANIIRPGNSLFPILEKQPSAITVRTSADSAVTPIMTFRTADNRYCREFKVTTGQTVTRSVACRTGGAWIVKTSVTTQNKVSAGGGQYQTATGPDNSPVDTVILGLMKGDALGARQEARIIQNDWK